MAPRWLEAGAESLENGALGVKNGGRILENGVVNGDRSCLENGVVNGDRSLENGVVNGDRSLESGVVNGDRSLETGAPSVVNRDFSLDLSVVNGDRSLEAGIVVTGDRSLETGAWSEVNGDRSPRSGARGVGNGDRSLGSGTPRVVNADRSVDLSEVTGDRSVQTGVPSVVNNDLTLQTGAAGVVDNDLTLQTGAAGVVDDIRRPQDHARSLEGARPRRRPASTARKGRSSRTQRGVQASRDSSPEDGGWREGKCGKNSCDMELGCENHGSQDHHRCVCPHDYKPPRRDQKCSRNVVAPHHRAAGVPNIYVMPVGATPGTATPGTEASTSRSGARPALTPPPSTGPPHPLAGRGHDTDPGGLGHGPGHGPGNGGGPTAVMESSANLHSILMIVVPILVAFFVAWCVCCRYGRSRKNQTPRSLSKGPLGSELFLPNPQYSVGLAALGDAAHGQQTVVPLIDRRALTLHENIGEGCFGKVFRGELKSADCPGGQTVAVKVLKESATREAEEDFMREVEVMSAFQHPHILRLIGVLPREPQSAPCMVFEFMPFGDLTEVLRCSSKSPWMPPRPGLPPLSQEALLGVALQIALGMRYLANQRFVHRDLACRNCLVGHNLTVKIADFGMSRDVYTCDYYKMGGTRALPVRWMSPEALLYGRFTLESDVWSFGVVLWEVFTRGKLPYYGHANDEALELVLRGVLLPLPEDPACPAAVLDLMRCCWRTEPRDRLRFPEVCSRLEEALEASLREMRLESDALDAELPRPPGFPAVYPDLGLEDLPALPDDLLLLPPPSPAAATAAAACPGGDAAGRADGCEELQLDPENYLLPRVPDPVRVEYMEPIAD